MDITEHPTDDGKVYLAVVLDAFSRRVIGWSIAEHMRAGLVADALQMATWRRRPAEGQTIAYADQGTPAGCSAPACARPACSARWAASGTASTVSMIPPAWRVSAMTLVGCQQVAA